MPFYRLSTWQKYTFLILTFLALITGGGGILWVSFFGNPLDATWLRLTKQCSRCRFEFSNANFRDTDLAGADLSYASLSTVDFSRANLEKANLSFVRSEPGSPVILQSVNLRNAVVNDAVLANANLANASLDKTVLQRADLIYANLTNAKLTKANLAEARLTGAILLHADFEGANLANAKMCFLRSLPQLDKAILKGAIITGAEKGFTRAQKQALQRRGAIVGGPSEQCY